MKYCPLMSFGKKCPDEVECLRENCAFADEDGDCLISQALAGYVAYMCFESCSSAGVAVDKIKSISHLEK